MEPSILGIFGVVLLFVLLAVGVHIGVALGLVGVIGSGMIVGLDAAIASAVQTVYHKVASFELITIPLFILMGYLASAGGISAKVFQSLNQWVGRFKGGLGISTVISCTAFGTVCGSSIVTASVFSRICAPEMRKFGYEKKIAYGICASGGMIGMLIPPSILMVVYGVLAGESIGRLLIAGVVPGLMLMVVFSLTILLLSKYRTDLIHDGPEIEQPSLAHKLKGLLGIWQIWVVALVVFGGIFGGVFNPTEAAAVASAFLLMLLAATRWRDIRDLLTESFQETASTSAMIFLVMGGAAVFSQFLVLTGLTELVASYVTGLALPVLALIWILVLVYTLLGCFLDSISMLCITVPIFNPILDTYGVDTIWYAVVVIMSIEAGLITPPVGLNVYGAYAVAEPDVTLEQIFQGVLPFFLSVWVVIALLIFFPSFSTALPTLMLGK
ncbi:MAG: TRAP transporter large permease [Pseudomonadota bacterium]